MLRRSAFLVAFVSAVFAARQGAGQTPLKRNGQVLIDPVAKTVIIGRKSKLEEERLTRENDFRIGPREVITIGIARQMPLVFKYTWNGITRAETADFQVAAKFAASLQALTAAAPFAGRNALLIPGAPIRANRVRAALDAVKFTDSLITELATLRNELKSEVASIPGIIKEVVTAEVAAIANANGSSHGRGNAAQTVDDIKYRILTDPTTKWDLGAKAILVDNEYRIVADARNALLAGIVDPTFIQDDPGLAEMVSLLTSEEAHIRGWLATAKQFVVDLRATDTELDFPDTVAYDSTHDVTGTMRVDYLAGAKDLVGELLPDGIEGMYSVVLKPYSPIALGAGLGSVFVFEKKPDNEYLGFRPVGMLTLSPSSWTDYSSVPHVEIGVTPESDHLAFYFGGGIRIRGAFAFVGGISAQQVKDEAGATSFHAAPYLGASIELAPKK